MASSSTPRWDALGSGPGFRSTTTAWDLRWWILMAVMTSVLVHAGIFVWMKRTKVVVPVLQAMPRELRTGVFHTEIERVTVPADIVKDLTPQSPDLTHKLPDLPAITKLPDITQLAEALKDKDIVLTPTLKTQAANIKLSTPAPGTAGDLLDDPTTIRSGNSDLSNTLMSKSNVLKNAQRAADDQVSMDLSEVTGGGADVKSDILSSLKKGTGGNGGVDGFASLDDLVNAKGPITEDFKTMLKTDLLFDFGSSELKTDARISLRKLAAIIMNNSDAIFRLIGHTDTIGDEAANLVLSEARAQSVKDWLVETLRIDGTNILVEGRGKLEPLPDVKVDGTAAEQAMNRRVEIHKTKK